MRWITNGIKFERGNRETLLAQFDNDGLWYTPRGQMTQSSARALIKLFGEAYDAEQVELTTLSNSNISTKNIVVFQCHNGVITLWDVSGNRYNTQLNY